jgi:hypothetical protein
MTESQQYKRDFKGGIREEHIHFREVHAYE